MNLIDVLAVFIFILVVIFVALPLFGCLFTDRWSTYLNDLKVGATAIFVIALVVTVIGSAIWACYHVKSMLI